jgi:hypothetical protein
MRPPSGGGRVLESKRPAVEMVLDLNGDAAFSDGNANTFLAGFGRDAPSDQHTGLAPDLKVLNTPLTGRVGEGRVGVGAIQRPDALVVDQYLEEFRTFLTRAPRLIVQGVKQMCAIVVELWCFHGAVPPDPLQREPRRLPFSADVYGD